MGLLIQTYSFADVAKNWANELGRDPKEVATVLANAMLRSELAYQTHDPKDPGPSHNQEIPYSEDLTWQEFDAGLLDHLHFVAKGIDSPDFEKAPSLRHSRPIRCRNVVGIGGRGFTALLARSCDQSDEPRHAAKAGNRATRSG